MLVGIGVFADTMSIARWPALSTVRRLGWAQRLPDGEQRRQRSHWALLALGAGYDWWVADEWSIGVMGRIRTRRSAWKT